MGLVPGRASWWRALVALEGGGETSMKGGGKSLALPQQLRTPLSYLGLSFLSGPLGGSWGNPFSHDD